MFGEIKRLFERLSDKGFVDADTAVYAENVLPQILAADTIARAYKGEDDAASNTLSNYDKIAEEVSVKAHEGGVRMLEAIITTGDITVVANRVNQEIIPAEEPISTESVFMRGARKRAHSDFKGVNPIKLELDTLGTFLTPEGTNVRYEPFEVSEEGYTIAKYARAIGWTYEAKRNNDMEAFLDQAQALGYAARLTRLRVLFEAIISGSTRTTPSGGDASAGGPTRANVLWAIQELQKHSPPRRLGGLAGSLAWELLADETLGNRYVPGEVAAIVNPAYKKAAWHTEEYLPEVLADAPSGSNLDWLGFDARISTWLEFGYLREFRNPRIVFKAPDTRNAGELGSFDNMTDAVKIVDFTGAKVTDPSKLLRVAGE